MKNNLLLTAMGARTAAQEKPLNRSLLAKTI